MTSVDPAGRMFAFTPSTGQVARVDAAEEETVAARWQLEPVDADPEVQITSVGGHWAVLDDARACWLEGRTEVDLSGLVEPADDPVLQAPSLEGDSMAVAHREACRGRARRRRAEGATPTASGGTRRAGPARRMPARRVGRRQGVARVPRHGRRSPGRLDGATGRRRLSPSSPTATRSC